MKTVFQIDKIRLGKNGFNRDVVGECRITIYTNTFQLLYQQDIFTAGISFTGSPGDAMRNLAACTTGSLISSQEDGSFTTIEMMQDFSDWLTHITSAEKIPDYALMSILEFITASQVIDSIARLREIEIDTKANVIYLSVSPA